MFAWLITSTFVGLNPQEPVCSQTIIDNFLGIAFGMWIATIVNRLLWPILPQKVLRHSLVGLCTWIKASLSGDPHREKILTQLANLIVEALAAARQIRIAGCSGNEREKLAALIHTLQMLVGRISQLVSRRNLLPEVTEQIMRLRFEHLEIEFKQTLDAFADCFRAGDCSREFPTVDGALIETDHAVEQMRDRNLLGKLSPDTSLGVLDLVDRYHAITDALAQCGSNTPQSADPELLGRLRALREERSRVSDRTRREVTLTEGRELWIHFDGSVQTRVRGYSFKAGEPSGHKSTVCD